MARYQIIIAYDGTRFAGSQRQGNSRTVQGVLEGALGTVGWRGKSVVLSGRTDSGVHASGQVAAFDMDWPHGPEALLKALNAMLPEDVSVRKVRIAPDHFHPRFDAEARRYVYRLFCEPVRNPLRERFAWRVWPAVDASLLHSAAAALCGAHDFACFGSPPRAGGSTLRTVQMAAWQRDRDELLFEVQANAFLYRMVRRMVYVQVAVGQGRIGVDAIRMALEGRDELPAGLAPACGLTLMDVIYPSDEDLESKK